MRYALVNGLKSEPTPRTHGVCFHCGSKMISKCGKYVTWHWAHKGREMCDSWWDSETEWHRKWKNEFPMEWQEIGHIDKKTGEKHIADVLNPYGLVIEFQHSSISIDELKSRENYYKNMIWVVDGSQGLNIGYFKLGLHGPIQDDPLVYKIEWMGRSKLFQFWGQSSTNVYLDFNENCLWHLIFFDNTKRIGAIAPIPKSMFVDDCKEGTNISKVKIPEGADRNQFIRPNLQEYSKENSFLF